MLTSKFILFSLLVLSTICTAQEPVEKDYDINLHVIHRKKLEDLLYNTPIHTLSVSTRISRVGAQFHSIVDKVKKRETYAIDHCHDPGKKSASSKLLIMARSHLKIPCPRCRGPGFWGIPSTTKALLQDPIYFRLSQHSDQMKMVDSETGHFKYQWDFKYGDPVHTKKLATGITLPTSPSSKNLASRINRWLRQACQQDYLKSGHTMKKLKNEQYQDFLLGTHCGIGIIEVLVTRPGGEPFQPGLVFYNHQLNDALLIEVLPQDTASPVQQAEACPVSTPVPEFVAGENPLPSYHTQDPLPDIIPQQLSAHFAVHDQCALPDAPTVALSLNDTEVTGNSTNSTPAFLMPIAAELHQLNLNGDDDDDIPPPTPCSCRAEISF